jgi:uncharacterized membrane protein
MMDIERYLRLNKRISELVQSINTINNYDNYLRLKYYHVLLHSIDLLKQYTIELHNIKEL